jgi:hypothetical protein
MQSHKANPATLAARGVQIVDLAGASITSELIASPPPIQADPITERRFANALAARVFGAPVQVVRRRRRTAA